MGTLSLTVMGKLNQMTPQPYSLASPLLAIPRLCHASALRPWPSRFVMFPVSGLAWLQMPVPLGGRKRRCYRQAKSQVAVKHFLWALQSGSYAVGNSTTVRSAFKRRILHDRLHRCGLLPGTHGSAPFSLSPAAIAALAPFKSRTYSFAKSLYWIPAFFLTLVVASVILDVPP
jgi:hypothetical protein